MRVGSWSEGLVAKQWRQCNILFAHSRRSERGQLVRANKKTKGRTSYPKSRAVFLAFVSRGPSALLRCGSPSERGQLVRAVSPRRITETRGQAVRAPSRPSPGAYDKNLQT